MIESVCFEKHFQNHRRVIMKTKVHFEMIREDNGSIRHDINIRSIDFETNGRGGWVVRASVPDLCGGITTPFIGVGESESLAVLDLLRNICTSMEYVPAWMRSSKKV